MLPDALLCPALFTPERDRFLSGSRVVITIGPDGTPVPTPIWYLYREGNLYFRTDADSVKAANIRRDPRVSVCVQEERPPYQAVIVYGRAEVRDAPAWLAAEIPRHYLGFLGAIGYRRTAQQAIEGGEREIAIVLRPERCATFDFTPETPLIGRLCSWRSVCCRPGFSGRPAGSSDRSW